MASLYVDIYPIPAAERNPGEEVHHGADEGWPTRKMMQYLDSMLSFFCSSSLAMSNYSVLSCLSICNRTGTMMMKMIVIVVIVIEGVEENSVERQASAGAFPAGLSF